MITNNRLINSLLEIRDSIVHADNGSITTTLFIRSSDSETIVKRIESMILDELDGNDKKMMETFFELDV